MKHQTVSTVCLTLLNRLGGKPWIAGHVARTGCSWWTRAIGESGRSHRWCGRECNYWVTFFSNLDYSCSFRILSSSTSRIEQFNFSEPSINLAIDHEGTSLSCCPASQDAGGQIQVLATRSLQDSTTSDPSNRLLIPYQVPIIFPTSRRTTDFFGWGWRMMGIGVHERTFKMMENLVQPAARKCWVHI